jgi:hypothetical protein
MTAQIHDILVWRGHDYQLVGVDGLMAQGRPDLSAVPSTMYMFESIMSLATAPRYSR